MIPEDVVAERLAVIGAPVHLGPSRQLGHLIRAQGVGSSRAQRLFDDDIPNAPIRCERCWLTLTSLRRKPPASFAGVLPHRACRQRPQGRTGCQFLIYDDRRFGDVIEDVIAAPKAECIWKEGYDQERRIMQTFAWITGNRTAHLKAPVQLANLYRRRACEAAAEGGLV